MAARVLLVGAATDGPQNLPLEVSSTKAINEIFGGSYTQRFLITPTQTYAQLDYEPVNLPTNTLNGRKNYLYAPVYSGWNLDFGPAGGDSNLTLDIDYSPYVGLQDLLYSARWHMNNTGKSVWVARVGGELASVTVGEWKFEAIQAGARYNKVHITADASGATIWGLEPNFPTNRYDTTDGEELVRLIQRDYEQGASPVVVVSSSSTPPTAGSYLCSGGEDGVVDDDSVTAFFESMTLPAEVTHIVFLAEATPAMIAQVAEYLQSPNTQPRMFFFAAPTFVSPASGWVQSMASSLPGRLDLVGLVAGDIQTSLDLVDRRRYAVEAAAQAVVSDLGSNLTNAATRALSFEPRLRESDLNLLRDAGFMVLYRSISKDIAIYEGVTSSKDTTFLYSSKLVEITAIAYGYCLQFVGRTSTQGDQPAVAQELARRLTAVDYITVESVAVRVERDVMLVSITVLLPNEILEIDFQVKNN